MVNPFATILACHGTASHWFAYKQVKTDICIIRQDKQDPYRDVPSEAYPVGIMLHSENGYGFQIASPEKAICDELYKTSPLKNRDELERLLYEDIRIDKDEFFNLNLTELIQIATRYHTQNHRLLQTYVRRRIKNGSGN